MSEPLPTTALSLGPTDSFLLLSRRYIQEFREKIGFAIQNLTEEEVWWRPGEENNSVGNLLLHLQGNLSMWVLRGLGGQPFDRNRSAEFLAKNTADRAGLWLGFSCTVDSCVTVLEGLDQEDLSATIEVQNYSVTRLGALLHAVEHLSYHTGQILQIAKQVGSNGGIDLYPQHRNE